MNDEQLQKLIEHFDKRFNEQDAKFDKRFNEFDKRIDAQSEKFDKQDETFSEQFAKLYQHTEQQFAELHAELEKKADADRVYGTLDTILKNQETEQQERLIVNHQLDRHEGWIAQAADAIKVSYDPAS